MPGPCESCVRRRDGLLPKETLVAVATGTGWADAMDELDWLPGESIVVGSS